MLPKFPSLAGTCGIPAEEDRIYVKVDAAEDARFDIVSWPKRIYWNDGRSWEISSVNSRNEFGRADFGNLCVKCEVRIGRCLKTIWWEHGQWFVACQPTTQEPAAA